jgi:hypothetical protein
MARPEEKNSSLDFELQVNIKEFELRFELRVAIKGNSIFDKEVHSRL